MRKGVATIVGFVVASIIPAAAVSIITPLGEVRSLGSIAATFAVTYHFSALFTVGLGLPVFLCLRRFGPGNWRIVLAVGALLGALVAVALRLPNHPDPYDLIFTMPLAAASALAFWLIWRRGRDTSKNTTSS
jgi:hypothetical protein